MRWMSLVVVAMVAGCVPTGAMMRPMAQRTGARYPALPPDCPVEFVENAGSFNAGDHELLGNTTLMGADSFTETARTKLHPLACEWGASAVTIMASASSGMTVLFHRKHETPAAPIAVACTGKFVNKTGGIIAFDGSSTAKMAFAGSETPCAARGAEGSKVILTCGAGSQSGSFASDCTRFVLGGLEFTRAD